MVGENIKQLRKTMGYSISELAELAGVSKSYLSYIERDVQKNPSLQFLSKIASTLETEVEVLLGTRKSQATLTLDKEWLALLNRAIDAGLTKDELSILCSQIEERKFRKPSD
ncbi:helix-turn-helix domain-containing protein [Metabacillus malikii]|uniref:XRE family transcriptional regulator of biofilm formation n=1 Tax=Metabacillus malikii TaxID=1504265 RepID=A0ABT9ZI49_9BACI|nr:helix-turn-helix transcriptional regulator [Metabacillus malikii]MDQ0231957.1 XRE family transcriptional regulator of biofilm formation [Metabacillus malikii]